MTQHLNVPAQLQSILWIVLYLALPPLAGAMCIGLVVGIVQAVTQVQDQSLPMAAKMIVVAAVVMLLGPALVSPLINETQQLFDGFAVLTR